VLPLGTAESFRGGIDVVGMRALVWDGATNGAHRIGARPELAV